MPTILIVEDQPDLAAGLKDNCEYDGYGALTAADELDDLDLCACAQRGFTPQRLFDDPAVELDGHAGGVQLQLMQ
jgi:CheY-like chemotaxis protein